jgi:hypothetical protein
VCAADATLEVMKSSRDRTGAAALVAASVTGIVAFALFLAGGLLLWANGHYKDADGFLTTPNQRFESPSYAITTQNLEVGAGAPGVLLKADRYGTIRLETMAKGGKPLFIGVARTRDVDSYLNGSAHSVVSDIDYAPFRARYDQLEGARPPGPPGEQRIWAAQGEHALTWDVQSGDWSVVVMNADGSRGIAAAVSAGAKVPYIAEIAYVTLGLGLLFVIATTMLTMYGTRPVARKLAIA